MLILRRCLAALFPVVALLPAVLLLACPGGSSGGGTTASSDTAAHPAASGSAVAAASTSGTINVNLDPPASASASATASATASVSATVAAASSSAKTAPAATCGDKPLPACPLKKWMQANSGPAMSAKDFPTLVTVFNRIVTMAPPGYGNWGSIAKNGAQAAQSEDTDGCKAACRQCHDQYKAKFKADYPTRSRPI